MNKAIIDDKIGEIENWFSQNCDKAIIAFSGGVDSCLVAFLARKYLGMDGERDTELLYETLDQIESRYDCSDFLYAAL